MSLVIPNTFSAGTAISASDMNSNFTAVSSWANGGIINSNISTNAAIAVSKLEASTEHMLVTFPVTTGVVTVNSITGYIPLYNDSNGNWTAVRTTYVVEDPGSTLIKYKLVWGYYSGAVAPATWNETIIGSEVTCGSTDGVATQGSAAGGTLTFDANQRMLGLKITQAGVASSGLTVSVLLSRTIAAT